MLPGFKALKLYKGDTFSLRLTISADGDPYNITGHTFISQIKEKGKSTIAATFTCTIENAVSGTLLVALPSSESSKLNPLKKYEYDIEMNNDGSKSTIVNGPIIVVREVSS